MKIRLWFIRQTDKARLYSKVPPERNPGKEDQVWIPLSVLEHVTKRGNEHEVTMADWFGEKENL